MRLVAGEAQHQAGARGQSSAACAAAVQTDGWSRPARGQAAASWAGQGSRLEEGTTVSTRQKGPHVSMSSQRPSPVMG